MKQLFLSFFRLWKNSWTQAAHLSHSAHIPPADGMSFIDLLPNEILTLIFSYLPFSGQLLLRGVNRHFKQISDAHFATILLHYHAPFLEVVNEKEEERINASKRKAIFNEQQREIEALQASLPTFALWQDMLENYRLPLPSFTFLLPLFPSKPAESAHYVSSFLRTLQKLSQTYTTDISPLLYIYHRHFLLESINQQTISFFTSQLKPKEGRVVLIGYKKFNLYLTRFPEISYQKMSQYGDDIKELYLDHHRLQRLPTAIEKAFPKLEHLCLEGNQFIQFPEVIWRFSALKSVALCRNQITSLPPLPILTSLRFVKDIYPESTTLSYDEMAKTQYTSL